MGTWDPFYPPGVQSVHFELDEFSFFFYFLLVGALLTPALGLTQLLPLIDFFFARLQRGKSIPSLFSFLTVSSFHLWVKLIPVFFGLFPFFTHFSFF